MEIFATEFPEDAMDVEGRFDQLVPGPHDEQVIPAGVNNFRQSGESGFFQRGKMLITVFHAFYGQLHK